MDLKMSDKQRCLIFGTSEGLITLTRVTTCIADGTFKVILIIYFTYSLIVMNYIYVYTVNM